MEHYNPVFLKIKLSLAIGLFAFAVPLASRLSAADCANCGDYKGTDTLIGECHYYNVCAVCDGGTCCYSLLDCRDQAPVDGLSCSC